jgi:membrane protein DedA with SNARE-associated domain
MKHGNKTVFFGRFVSILRAWSAFLAGVNHMRWRSFLVYNAAGGIVWAIVYGLLGFVAGRYFKDNFTQVETIANAIGWAGAALVALIIILVAIIYLLRKRRNRSAQLAGKNLNAPTEQRQEEAAGAANEY